MKIRTLLLLGLLFTSFSSHLLSYPRNEISINEAFVDFSNIKDGDKISSPFTVTFKVSGMSISPAGEMKDGSGHHHLLINQTFIEKGNTIPADQNHLHFGKGQSEAELNLSPGIYNLTLQFADGYHRSYGKALSKAIQIEVK